MEENRRETVITPTTVGIEVDDAEHEKLIALSEAKFMITREVARQRASDILRLDGYDNRLEQIERNLAANTAMTTSSSESIKEILDLMIAGKGGIKMLGWLGRFLKWTAGVVGACALLWGALHGKFPGEGG